MASRNNAAAGGGGTASPILGGAAGGGGVSRRAGALWRLLVAIAILLVVGETVMLLRVDLLGNARSALRFTERRISGSRDRCEDWLEDQDRVSTLRDFDKDPVRVDFSETQGTDNCAVRCQFGVITMATRKRVDAVFGLSADEGVARVARTMESSQYYSEFELNTARSHGYTVIMTTSLKSDVPVGYFSWAEYDLMAPVQEKTEKSLAAAFISNCGGHNFRLEAITKLQGYGVAVDSYGSCLTNVHRSVEKVDALRHYKFSLAFENSNEEDYVTEKFWQSLEAGSVPVVIGAPNIQNFAPSPNSILYLKSIKDVQAVAKQMKYLARNATAYNETLRWKFEGPTDSFKALIDMAAVHSSCRLCIHVATAIHQKQEQEAFRSRNASRPCKCSVGSTTTFHLYVRERGRFHLESIFLRSDNLSVAALEAAIISKFSSKNHVPIWNAARPEMLKAKGPLKVHRVYPVGLTQREALFSWQFTDEDLVNHIDANPCAKLEVIFV
ncbi:glycoprotein 3-alpha-L-fucosyltransferase A [Selaginella moellendorffii]|uniref:glycoprotein 3-alpha-L-fucosyltransferase A n=1 Tax=Selaginella moellendorffii TaxID=88036 RepID=UPI000D1CE39E|nr:glycoprotein 3-alpha-L-fucosyltransferase A [Selaginella moellendorffii]|eukprot:XP_024531382.1 glycoprotein 3-alpha-L-fucosyltransferase A [Selaginella moellendorffii]